MASPRTIAPRGTLRPARLGALLGLALCATAPTASAQAGADLRMPERFVRVAEGGAQIRNLDDPKGVVVRSLRGGDLLGVRGERDAWLKVEPPQGLEVWIFGEFVRPAGSPGWLEVTGNNVNLRPLPHSQASSFPLEQRLHRGERVRLIERQDPTKPLEEDWVRIQTPPGIWGWVAASSTQPLPAGFDARAAWTSAAASAAGATPSTESRPQAVSPRPPAQAPVAGAQQKLDQAHQLYSSEASKARPDWQRVRQAYLEVLETDSQSSVAEVARGRLAELDTRLEVARLAADMARERDEREAELARLRKELEASTLRSDPLWGRYDARGWLEREKRFGEPTRYILRWGGERTAEVVCEFGRYDLEHFVGHELGLVGRVLASPREVASTPGARQRAGEGPPLPILDVRRLEVISGRAIGR